MSRGARSKGIIKVRHPSVTALLQHHPWTTDAKAIIRSIANNKIKEAKSCGWSGPPFCPKILASFYGIRCFEVGHDIHGDGRILRSQSGRPIIEYAADRLEVRKRFTIFHEFAHTFFPDYCEFSAHYHNSEIPLSSEEKEFEKLCDVGAAEMLFPKENFLSHLEKILEINFFEISKLANIYEGSIDATCLRLADFSNEIPISFVFLTDKKANYTGRGPLWVKYSCKNSLFKGYIPPGTTPPYSSVALECYKGEAETSLVKETWWIGGKPRTYLVQAFRLPSVENAEYPKVVILILPQSYKTGAVFNSKKLNEFTLD